MLGGHRPAEKYLCPRTRRIVTDSMSLRRNLRTVSSICLILFGVAPSVGSIPSKLIKHLTTGEE
jgi:hypothetical protein